MEVPHLALTGLWGGGVLEELCPAQPNDTGWRRVASRVLKTNTCQTPLWLGSFVVYWRMEESYWPLLPLWMGSHGFVGSVCASVWVSEELLHLWDVNLACPQFVFIAVFPWHWATSIYFTTCPNLITRGMSGFGPSLVISCLTLG